VSAYRQEGDDGAVAVDLRMDGGDYTLRTDSIGPFETVDRRIEG
jgi:hypothetical protein